MAHSGRCFCGAVSIEVSGEPLEMGYCHCGSCRLWSGGPVSAFSLWPAAAVKVTTGEGLIGTFAKTEFSHRQYCTRCGGHIMVAHPSMDLTDVCASMIPSLDFKPTMHLHYAETVLPMKDGLPKLKDFPKEAGGSGETVPE